MLEGKEIGFRAVGHAQRAGGSGIFSGAERRRYLWTAILSTSKASGEGF
jgi:hypothetical protein